MTPITVDTLIHAKSILTMAEPLQLDNMSLVIDKDKIVALRPTAEVKQHYQAHQEFNLPEHVLMPGLINAHTHLSMTLLRGLADDLKLMPWLEDHIWPAEKAVMSPEYVKDGALLGMAELLRSGTTTFMDNYFLMDVLPELVHQVGVRGFLGESLLKFPTPWSSMVEVGLERIKHLAELCRAYPTVYPFIFPHSPYATDLKLLEKVAAFKQEQGLLLQSHLLESGQEIDDYLKEYGKRPLTLWRELGLLGPTTSAVHMTHANEEDFAILVETGTHVVHCPESNMKLSSHVCEVQKMLDLGINVALGADGAASNDDLDLFSEMRSAAFLSKVYTDNPENLKAKVAIKLATVNGAKLLNLGHAIGTLEVGKQADVIAIDFDSLEMMPCYNIVSQLVYATPRSQVTHVWVDGKLLLDNRQLTTIDEEALKAKTRQWQEKLKDFAKQV